MQRRLVLETRTLTITLRSAIAELERDPAPTVEERIALRRAWCDRVAMLLQDVRTRAMRLQLLTAAGADRQAQNPALTAAEEELERLRGPAA